MAVNDKIFRLIREVNNLSDFKRKPIMSVLFLLCGLMIIVSALLQFLSKNTSAALFQTLVAFLFIGDAVVYMKPYISLDEEKLTVNNGLSKREIPFKNITSINDKSKKLIIIFNQGSSKQRVNILLSHLKKQDLEQFMKELRAKLGDEISLS
jgi:hypothetical protein